MTDTTATAAAGTEFSLGKVLRDTFSTYFNNFVQFILLGLLVYVPVVALSAALLGIGTPLQQSQVLATAGTTYFFSGIISIVTLVVYAFVNAGITFGSIESLNNRPFTFGALINRSFSTFFPILLATILVYIIVVLGMIALIVPGIIALLMFSVVYPVIIAERKGPSGALGRSRELTRGHRWAILGGYIVYIVIAYVVVIVTQLVAVFLGPIAVLIASLLTSAINATLAASYTASLYVNLRMAKEGAGIEELASVFD
jgi:hypothetical protein